MSVKIAIIDNGVWLEHPKLKNIASDINIKYICPQIPEGRCGHGTGVFNIIHTACPGAEITNFKVCNEDAVDEEVLCKCLEDIAHNYDFDVINISMGIALCNNLERLRNVCDTIVARGGIVVSAFDNAGAISYPAAFNSVIGVAGSIECMNKDDIVIYDDIVVNIGAKGGLQRIAWDGPEYIVVSGNSFACAHVTARIANLLELGIQGRTAVLEHLKEMAKHVEDKRKIVKKNACNFKIKKAALFPFNKEMHALIRFSHMLDFEIVEVYDTKYSAYIGAHTKQILNTEAADHQIKNIENVDWDCFDTLILGHTNALSSVLPPTFVYSVIEEAVKRKKNVFSFDDIADEWSTNNVYAPTVTEADLPHFRMGKLYRISKPVLGIFGTSSSQGKYTLQLELRKRFLADGYKLGQIGTEPTAELFNMDYAFPMGYSSSVNIFGHDVIRYLNSLSNDLCQRKNADIVIVGSQSSVIPFDIGNLSMFPVKQYVFLLGTQPDAVVLCVNPYDDIEYIKRSIGYLENLVGCKVIGMSLFPMDVNSDWTGIYGKKSRLDDDKCMSLKRMIYEKTGVPVFQLGNQNDIDNMYQTILSYFSEE